MLHLVGVNRVDDAGVAVIAEAQQVGTLDIHSSAFHVAAQNPQIARGGIIACPRHTTMAQVGQSGFHVTLADDDAIALARNRVRALQQAPHTHAVRLVLHQHLIAVIDVDLLHQVRHCLGSVTWCDSLFHRSIHRALGIALAACHHAAQCNHGGNHQPLLHLFHSHFLIILIV